MLFIKFLYYNLQIQQLYVGVPGTQTATVIQFQPGSVIVRIDLSTKDNYDEDQLRETLEAAVNNRYIGEYYVDPNPDHFKFMPVGVIDRGFTESPIVPCYGDQFQCNNGDCIPDSRYCDGYRDCYDGSDELNCPLPTPPAECRNDEFGCQNGQCIPAYLRCDRRRDCRDGSDENDCFIETQPPPSVSAIDTQATTDSILVQWIPRTNTDIVLRGYTLGLSVGTRDVYTVTLDRQVTQYTIENLQPSTVYLVTLRTFNNFGQSLPTIEVVSTESSIINCSPGEFQCQNQLQCIDERRRCDGRSDCNDGSDEQLPSCPVRCNSQEFTCADLRRCIPIIQHCDGTNDCADNSDEYNCPEVCITGQFQCLSGQCIGSIQYCDGYQDCPDNSDEADCPQPIPTTTIAAEPAKCSRNERMCRNGQCVKNDYFCDGDFDCDDRTDEENCAAPSSCEPNEFECRNQQCAQKIWKCDGEVDCLDGSDEFNCDSKDPNSRCESFQYMCLSGDECIPKSYQCDDEIDCRDRSDEIGWVTVTSINGLGVLTIKDVHESDSGAYTCEAMNNKGYLFALPDAIVIVTPPEGHCTGSLFNAEAVTVAECVSCFCFGIAQICFSSTYNVFQETLDFTQPGIIFDMKLVKRRTTSIEPIDDIFLGVNTATAELYVQDITTQIGQGEYHWMLPQQFLGNQLTSYGGLLQYMVRYETNDFPKSSNVPDVVLQNNWDRIDTGRGDIPITTPATREDLMMVLENIDTFMIRASYQPLMTYTSISDISLDFAVPRPTGQERAVLVEDCTCPLGYSGLSCEDCAIGYRRVENNQYLGTCVECNCNGHASQCDQDTGVCRGCRDNTVGAFCDTCANGYYGNAITGQCLPCPCPLTTPENQFSPTCYMDADNLPTCDSCPVGYTGRNCERCAPGFEGNPSQPGDSCVISSGGVVNCDERGGDNLYDGRCQCKGNTFGESCDQCQPNTFYLSSDNPDGCISCFCMGITNQCQSTSQNRAQVFSSFSSPEDVQGFSLVNRAGTPAADAQLAINPASQELLFSGFRTLSPGVYYYQLPAKFRGDKVSSYGGYLRYTITHRASPGSSPMNEPDVMLQGNDITLYHYSEKSVSTNGITAYQVPFYETYWKRRDGAPAMRVMLMMALADIDLLMVRASLSTHMFESSVKDVSMDIAEPRNTGQPQAYPVEECSCPTGYRGLSCEDCELGYTRSHGGLYLGMCMPCGCNGHARECDSETGECRNCLHNTEGPNCERCIHGYYGNPSSSTNSGCLPCPCPLTSPQNQFSASCYLDADGLPTCNACQPGYTGRNCERCVSPLQGDPTVPGETCSEQSSGGGGGADCPGGQCPCKANTEGPNCNVCIPGFFNLDENNPDGCTPCFCAGITDQCQSSNYYRANTAVRFDSLTNNKNIVLQNRARTQTISTGFTMNPDNNEIIYSEFSSLPPDTYFWSLSPKFRGNQITAYGGYLRFTLFFTASTNGRETYDVDIGIEGNDIYLYHRLYPSVKPGERKQFEIPVTEDNFYRFEESKRLVSTC
uniref:Basement membrane-specific heparan sulfate proteoglycan core protein-like n=1 Tax=Saccoglossus kowalevskii TaxID=10224 RepID=A0ABM0MPA0_SACKO|nr:PREDICTED: basement membrane-specific heparan sulfate proteoglycan core protein-like [Saccoglossus kowalevskii]